MLLTHKINISQSSALLEVNKREALVSLLDQRIVVAATSGGSILSLSTGECVLGELV